MAQLETKESLTPFHSEFLSLINFVPSESMTSVELILSLLDKLIEMIQTI